MSDAMDNGSNGDAERVPLLVPVARTQVRVRRGGIAPVEAAVDAAANLLDLALGNQLLDLTPARSVVVDKGPQRTVRRYEGHRSRGRRRRAPVLLVPPLAAPISCFDLHRGASLARHLTRVGYPTYVVDYGPISFGDRALGLEHWVDGVIPDAVSAVANDAGEGPLHVVGWCLGGIMSALAFAAHHDLPVASLSLVASPFDFSRVGMLSPVRWLGDLTGGGLESAFYRALGGIPAPLVSLGFRLTALDRYLKRPLFLASKGHDRRALGHMQAVDDYLANMLAYPGRTMGQLYHALFRANDLAGGAVQVGERSIALADLELPVLAVAGDSDVLAPPAAVHCIGDLLPASKEVRLERAPGGHLGVLTGMGARSTTWEYLDEFLAAHDPLREGMAA